MGEDLRTGDLVLCKVGSFAPWPAVVFPQRLLRKDVYRRRRADCVAVCFLNDETYYWDKPARLKRLEKDTIRQFLDDAAMSGDVDEFLVGAYEEAADYDSLHEFIMRRLSDEGRTDDWDGKEKLEAGQDPFEGKKSESPAAATTTTKSKNKRPRSAKSADNENGMPRSTEDNGTSSNKPVPLISKSRDSAKTDRKRQRLDQSRRIEITLLFRRKLQRNLVQRDTPPSDDEIKESHKLLRKINENLIANDQFFDINALRQSKLHKLLKVISNDRNLEEFHEECTTILDKWSPIIRELKLEKLKTKT